MKIQTLIIGGISALAMVSCGGSKEEKLAKQTVLTFFKALKTADSAGKIANYPDFAKIPGYYKSDSVQIVSTEKDNDKIKVKVHNRFTNIKGKLFEQDMVIFVTVNGEKATISNSLGMFDAKEQELYPFALKTGCLKPNQELKDLEMAEILKQASDLMIYKAQDLINDLIKQVPLTGLNWNPTMGVGSGSATVTNNSPYPLFGLKYKLFFTDAAGQPAGGDDGYVSFDTIAPGAKHKFEFMALQSAEAKHMDLQLVYDKYFLLNCLKTKSWTGKEYDEWKAKTGGK